MNIVELSNGMQISIPTAEKKLLISLLNTKLQRWNRNSFTPRAEALATNLVGYQILNRINNEYVLRNIEVIK